MKIVRDIIRPVVVLVVITLVVSAALALTYQFTKPEEGASGPDMDLIETAGKEAMPEADGFTQLDQYNRGSSLYVPRKQWRGYSDSGRNLRV